MSAEPSSSRPRLYRSGTSFAMPFSGSEIWFSELSGLGRDQANIAKTLREQGAIWERGPGKRNVALNFAETRLNRANRGLLVHLLTHKRLCIRKLVIVSCGFCDRWALGFRLRRFRATLGFRYTFLDDYERAKVEVIGR